MSTGHNSAVVLASLDQLFVTANRVEGVFWCGVAGVVGVATLRGRVRPRWQGVAAVLLLIAFGASDWVEATTGAWYRPWWLFVWKALCVVTLAAFGFTQRRHARSRPKP